MRPGTIRAAVPWVSAFCLLVGAAQPAQAEGPGEQRWAARYNGPANGVDAGQAVGVSPDATRVFVTGSSQGLGTGGDWVTTAYDAVTGAPQWIRRYDGGGNEDTAVDLTVAPDGSKVFVTGLSSGSNGDAGYATVAYMASTGAQLWVAGFNGSGQRVDQPAGIATSPDGSRVFVTGWSYQRQFVEVYATVAYDASDGRRLWTQLYGDPSGANQASAIGVSQGGSTVFVTGESHVRSTDAYDYATVAYDAATGARRWVSRYDGPEGSDDVALDLAVAPGGGALYVTGHSFGASGTADYATVAYDASSGGQLWVARYDGPAHGNDYPLATAVSPGGSRVFVTGYTTATNGLFDYGTVAYDAATGGQLWGMRYDGSGHGEDDAFALVVAPGGSKVFVTGLSLGSSGGVNAVTLAYDAATGAFRWRATYNGPANGWDSGRDLAVSPSGSAIFVTGSSPGLTSDLDVVTVAYST
jgi:putative pyrroloquinoline-quinone binding quinoprotein